MSKVEFNLALSTDSYKVGHFRQYPAFTSNVFSYFCARDGAEYDETVFFGLQPILMEYIAGQQVTQEKIEYAANYFKHHLGSEDKFNRKGWEYILNVHDGYLPLKIKAVPEGLAIPKGNILFAIENIDTECYWLPGYVEGILSKVWAPSTVATVGRAAKKMLAEFLEETSDSSAALDWTLHDFGYRSVSSETSAGLLGMAHLVNWRGSDTMVAGQYAEAYYGASLEGLSESVEASEHSTMTSLGRGGESQVVQQLLHDNPTGILSVVIDSFSTYNFIEEFVCNRFAKQIMERDGVFVVRPDSVTPEHPTPEAMTLWIVETLWRRMGGEVNSKGFRSLTPKLKVLYGDGINVHGIKKILQTLKDAGYSSDVMVFGMGSALLQDHTRDRQNFALKCSAQKRDGMWHDIKKETFGKESKAGRLMLQKIDGQYVTTPEDPNATDILETVFEDGKITKLYTFDQVRENAKLPLDIPVGV